MGRETRAMTVCILSSPLMKVPLRCTKRRMLHSECHVVLPFQSSHNDFRPPLTKTRRENGAGQSSVLSLTTLSIDGAALVAALEDYVDLHVPQAGGTSPKVAGQFTASADGSRGVWTLSPTTAFIESLSAEARARLAALPYPRLLHVEDTQTDYTIYHTCRAPQSVPAVPTWKSSPLLLVGAGGIGCELLKVLILRGFRHVVIVDLDTIDATNLNRQFLFNSADVGRSKALTARTAVLRWYENRGAASAVVCTPPTVVAYHENIKSDTFDEAFYRGFAAVMNALDNVSARQHVNRMCMRANVPLFESGTMGYNGQVQPILRGVYECYDCNPKPAGEKSFAVCTIHARPTTMVHCVHYAKELYETLFGAGADEKSDATREHGTSPATGNEMDYVHWTMREWRSTAGGEGAAALAALGERLAHTLFHEKIVELLTMKSNWPTAPPVPLALTQLRETAHGRGPLSPADISRDAVLSTEDLLRLFLRATATCAQRIARREYVSFRKEDDSIVDFVAATANLRAQIFHITGKSVEELRTIAGSIVPAIATTNAIVAAGVVQQLELLLSSPDGAKQQHIVYVRRAPQTRRRVPHTASQLHCEGVLQRPHDRVNYRSSGNAVTDRHLIVSVPPSPPCPTCAVCQSVVPRVDVEVDVSTTSLREFVSSLLVGLLEMEAPSVACAARIIYEEEDYEELADHPLSSFASAEAMAAGRPIVFLVDALNRAVEWQITVKQLDGVDVKSARVLHIESALAAERNAVAQQALREREAAKANVVLQQPGNHNTDRPVGGTAEGTIIVDTDSDADADEDIIFVD